MAKGYTNLFLRSTFRRGLQRTQKEPGGEAHPSPSSRVLILIADTPHRQKNDTEVQWKSGHSPGKHTAREYEENTNHYVVPKLCGTKLWCIVVHRRSCEYCSSNGILDKRDSKRDPDVR